MYFKIHPRAYSQIDRHRIFISFDNLKSIRLLRNESVNVSVPQLVKNMARRYREPFSRHVAGRVLLMKTALQCKVSAVLRRDPAHQFQFAWISRLQVSLPFRSILGHTDLHEFGTAFPNEVDGHSFSVVPASAGRSTIVSVRSSYGGLTKKSPQMHMCSSTILRTILQVGLGRLTHHVRFRSGCEAMKYLGRYSSVPQ